MKHFPISTLGLSLSNSGSHRWVVAICLPFLFHTSRQWLVMVEFSLARSRWKEPSVPHVHVWEIYWLPHTHTQNVNGSFRSAAALRSKGHPTGCICGKKKANQLFFLFPRIVSKLFCGGKPTTTRLMVLIVCNPSGRLPRKIPFNQQARL